MSNRRIAAFLLAPLTLAVAVAGAAALSGQRVAAAQQHSGHTSPKPSSAPTPNATPATATPSPTPTASPAATSTPTATATASPTATATTSPAPSAAPLPTPTTSPAPAGPWLGVLQTTPANAATERVAAVTRGDLELSWSQYEPQPGVFDGNYIAAARSRLATLQQTGLQVTLDVGLQYPPAWVFSLDSATRFVDQYGDVWQGSLSEDVPDAVFDSTVRAAEATYIAHVAADLGNNFEAVRAGGLLQDELRYPDATDNGHTNCYWAFDAHAQATSPVPGWRPGQPDTTKASLFLTWYLQSIDGFETWLLGTYRAAFPTAWLQVLLPSWGLRPGDTAAAVQTDLNGSTPPATWGTLEMGLDWSNQVAALPGDSHVMPYSTWLERGDDGTTPQTLGPAHYLVTLAQPLGRHVAGENAGATDSVTTMQTIVQRVKSWGLVGLMWLDESSLFGSGPVHLSDLTAAMFS